MSGSVDPDRSEWDVVVIGGGPPGENAAPTRSRAGLSAVIVETELLGGECSYWACMPSKALLRPLELLDSARAMPGVAAPGRRPGSTSRRSSPAATPSPHTTTTARRSQWADRRGHRRRPRRRPADGRAHRRGHRAGGGTRTLTARHAVVLATGTPAAVPPVQGCARRCPWTSRDVTNLHEVPERVLVVGGGVVACESATWLRGLGTERADRRRARPAAARPHRAVRRRAGRRPAPGGRASTCGWAPVERVERTASEHTGEGRVHGGEVTVTLSAGDGGRRRGRRRRRPHAEQRRDLGLDTRRGGRHGQATWTSTTT